MTPSAGWPRWVLPAVLLAATGLFVFGVSLEPDAHTRHEGTTAVADSHGNEPAERAEGDHAEPDEARSESGEAAGERSESDEAGEERVLGLNLESPLPLTVTLIMLVTLTALAWARPDRRLSVVIAVVTAGFAVLDTSPRSSTSSTRTAQVSPHSQPPWQRSTRWPPRSQLVKPLAGGDLSAPHRSTRLLLAGT